MNESPSVKTEPASSATYALPSIIPPWLGWAAALCFFFSTLFFAAKSFNVRGQLQTVLEAERVARLEAGTLKNLLEAERILSRGQIDRLANAEMDRLVIVPLAPSSPEGNSHARATVVWNPSLREGVFSASDLPVLPADQVYQLWATGESAPINIAVFTVAPESRAVRILFDTAGNTLSQAPSFTVTIEPKNGVARPEGPALLQGR
jgi:hypothetical protein